MLEGLESGGRRVRGDLRRLAKITGDRALDWGREQASSPPATRFNDNNTIISRPKYIQGECARLPGGDRSLPSLNDAGHETAESLLPGYLLYFS